MRGQNIKLLITDFDGTLVKTFRANYLAYQKAFNECGLSLTEEAYYKCFGYRFERFMEVMEIKNKTIVDSIREKKARFYHEFFSELQLNEPLYGFIKSFKCSGGKTAIASTARRKNLTNALEYLHLLESFDLILGGEDVNEGKPSPEIYLNVLKHFECEPQNALVFEDSFVGIEAAQRAGVNYVAINSHFYGN